MISSVTDEAEHESTGLDYSLLGVPAGFMPTMQYTNDAGERIVSSLSAELVHARRERSEQHGSFSKKLRLAVDDVLKAYPKSLSLARLPILEHFHPNIPFLDSLPILLFENSPIIIRVAQQEEWERLDTLYGPPNAIQKEEHLVLDKMAYLVAHHMEASARGDILSKSVLTSLRKDLDVALAALNADDYTARELAREYV